MACVCKAKAVFPSECRFQLLRHAPLGSAAATMRGIATKVFVGEGIIAPQHVYPGLAFRPAARPPAGCSSCSIRGGGKRPDSPICFPMKTMNARSSSWLAAILLLAALPVLAVELVPV